MSNSQIYLDYAAATPTDSAAIEAMSPYISNSFFNPSAVYQAAREVRKDLEVARATVANVLGAKDQEVIFTAGGTEANNIAIRSIMEKYPNGNIVVSAIEHESVLMPAGAFNIRIAPVSTKGLVDVTKLADLIDQNTVLVSVMYANNEIGTVQPLSEISKIIEQKRTDRIKSRNQSDTLPLYFHTDACQAANYLDLQVSRLGVDLMTLNGGKIYGVKQSGCLYVKAGVNINHFILGGGQENGIRSGTENVSGQIAFATMLQKVQLDRKHEVYRLQQIQKQFIATLSQNLSDIIINGDLKHRLPNNINLIFPGADGERLLMELDEAGIMVATGSACTASNDLPSHVLLAIGLQEVEAAASIRITFGRPTTENDAQEAVRQLITVVQSHTLLV